MCAALGGAGLGFLWFNGFPATVFMGDTGSLALGGAVGLIAVAARQELTLFVAGGVFVAEAVSVILQRRWFKFTGGKRLFKCAPLHHHFQFNRIPRDQDLRFALSSHARPRPLTSLDRGVYQEFRYGRNRRSFGSPDALAMID